MPAVDVDPVLAQQLQALEGAAGRFLAVLEPLHAVHRGEAQLGVRLAEARVARGQGRDVADPVAERVGLRRDAAALAEGCVESLPLGDREDRAAADALAREGVGLARPVADRDVDRDPPHVGQLLERRVDTRDQPRLEEAASREHDGHPAELAPVDSRYAFRHRPSLTENQWDRDRAGGW